MKQAIEPSVFGFWGPGTLPSPSGGVDSFDNEPTDSGNLRDAVIHASLQAGLTKCMSLKGSSIEAQIAKFTSEHPNDSSYGRGFLIDSFMNNELSIWNHHRRIGTIEA